MANKAARGLGLGLALAVVVVLAWFLTRTSAEEGSPSVLTSDAPEAETPTFAAELDVPRQAVEVEAAADEPPAGEAAALDPLTLEVVHADETAVVGAAIVVARDEAVLAVGTTDAQGSATLDAIEGGVTAYVGGVSTVPMRHQLDVGSGLHRVTLPLGAIVAGIVTVDGGPPIEPVPLAIQSDPLESPNLPGPIMKAFRVQAPGIGSHFLWNGQLVTAPGRFAFIGLQPDWKGDLLIGSAYGLADGKDRLALEYPTTDLVLDLFRRPTIRGRVVDENGEPVPFAWIEYRLQEGRMGLHATMECDEGGRFAIALKWGEPVRSLELRIQHPTSPAYRELILTELDHELGEDIGDIALEVTRTVVFFANDTSGGPIEGAVATLGSDPRIRSEPTDHDGRGELSPVTLGEESMTVYAERCSGAEVAIPPAPASPIDVVLESCASVDVSVTKPDGTAAPGVMVKVAADSNLFEPLDAAPEHFLPSWGHPRFDLGLSRSYESGQQRAPTMPVGEVGGYAWFRADEDGHVHLSCLRPNRSFQMRVEDRAGCVLYSERLLTLTPGEQTELRVTASSAPRDLVGVVIDEHGSPVPEADVYARAIGTDRRNALSAYTESDGTFRMRDVYCDRLALRIEKDGVTKLVVPEVSVPDGGPPLEFVLVPSLEVRVLVVDSEGERVPVRYVHGLVGPIRLPGRRAGDEWLLTGLTAGSVEIVVNAGGHTWSHWHDAEEPEAVVVAPAHGSLRVHWPDSLAKGGNHRLSITPLMSGGDRFITSVGELPAEPEGELVPFLLPGDYAVVLEHSYDYLVPRTPLTGTHRVHVVAGEEAVVALRP